jgi:hypothetical protein
VQASGQIIPAYHSLYGENGGTQALQRSLTETAFQLYGEYGLRKNTTLVGAFPIRYMRSGEAQTANPAVEKGALTALGNTFFSIRQQLTHGRLPLTFTLRTDLPSGKFEAATGLRTGYKAWTFLPMVSTGMGFRRAYWFAWGGYGWRTNGYSHLINIGAEAGWKVRQSWIIGFSEWVHPTQNGDIVLHPANLLTGLYVNHQGYHSIGLKTMMPLGRFLGFMASAAGAASGQNVPRKPAFSAGIWFKWE